MAGQLTVDLGERSYEIYCGSGLLPRTGFYLHTLDLAAPCLVVSNATVAGLYWPAIEISLKEAGFQPHLALVPDGEEAKSLEVAAGLYNAALDAGIERRAAVIALGGGVAGDVAGFIAATWLRGVPFIQIPTTILAQVDSSVGGKVAVNHPKGKNLIGAFYQPRMVLADTDALTTLPPREIRAGLAEVIKYGVIADAGFFAYLEEHLDQALRGDRGVLESIILRCCALKAKVVAGDEREKGLRAILNFGHTVGHAVEAVTGFNTYRHGEAVAMGMVAAARMAVQRGMFSAAETGRLVRLLERAGLPVTMPALDPAAFRAALGHDKKIAWGQLRMILPERLGRVQITPIAVEEIMAVLGLGNPGAKEG
ncbi:3-dehydroquinate synthase [Moorella naiadis]|uniref:3-dehydroquinate synthase n=1 Tax=Moorella naiadis (nom. illeg.) TaxID=3093670 RepID=UPI003D9CBADE